jgi:restriction system protein
MRFSAGQQWRSDRDKLRWIRGMKPNEFEDYVATLFQKLGYTIEITGGPHDRGIDIVVEKNGIKHYIQCKKFITSVVSASEVRDFYGAIVDHLAHGKAYFITTNKFTLDAEKFCEDKPIELIDGLKLLKYIHLVDKRLEDGSTIGPTQERCPECNGLLIKRNGKYGDFYGCSNYPKCKFTKNF